MVLGVKRPGGAAGIAAKRAAIGQGNSPGLTGEVRFDNPKHVMKALALNGSDMLGNIITVELDTKSKDSSKVIVGNIPSGAEWQELKDHFAKCGTVAFSDVKGTGRTSVGTIRYATTEEADQAMAMFNGADLMGSTIEVKKHPGSKDNTKLQVFGIPSGCEWQELKDFFGSAGSVIFSEVASSKGNTVGEIRFDNPAHAQIAVNTLNGSVLGGSTIKVTKDHNSMDGSKLVVTNLPAGIEWQDLKDHFNPIGTVAFANVNAKGKGKGGGGKGGGGNQANLVSLLGQLGGGGGGAGLLGQLLGGGGGGGGNGNLLSLLGGLGGGKGGGGGKMVGEVRYDDPLSTQLALSMLNGSDFYGSKLKVTMDYGSQDGTKLYVEGIPAGTGWQDLKDHFAQISPVAFCNVGGAGGKGGKAGAGGKGGKAGGKAGGGKGMGLKGLLAGLL